MLGEGFSRLVAKSGLLLLLILLILAFGLVEPDTFLTAFTFQSLMSSNSINALLALAVMIPLCASQYDLSVASTLSIAQVLANGLQTQQHLSWPLTMLVVLCIGAAIGFVNGFLVTRIGINSFIATLGSGTVLLGLNESYTGGAQIMGTLPPGFLGLSGQVADGIPAPVVYVLILSVLLWFVLGYLPAGRFLYVTGDNPRAAQLSGIKVNHYIMGSFIAAGGMAAFAGIVLESQLRVGQSSVGQELLLPAFTGALLGATSVNPGRPNVWGTVLAVAVLAVTVAGLSQLGAPFYVAPLFNGSMLVVAVGLAIQAQRRREALSRARQGGPAAAKASPAPSPGPHATKGS